MAKATAKTVTKVEGVTLELSEAEAQALFTLVGRVRTIDGDIREVYTSLKDAGITAGDFSVYQNGRYGYESTVPTLSVSKRFPG